MQLSLFLYIHVCTLRYEEFNGGYVSSTSCQMNRSMSVAAVTSVRSRPSLNLAHNTTSLLPRQKYTAASRKKHAHDGHHAHAARHNRHRRQQHDRELSLVLCMHVCILRYEEFNGGCMPSPSCLMNRCIPIPAATSVRSRPSLNLANSQHLIPSTTQIHSRFKTKAGA